MTPTASHQDQQMPKATKESPDEQRQARCASPQAEEGQ